MAHVFDLTLPAKPVLALTLEAGGTLEVGVPHFYRVATASTDYSGSGQWISPAADVQSITPTSTHRSVRLTYTHYSGAAEYTIGWVAKGADPGVGNWNDRENFGDAIRCLGSGGLYHRCFGNAKTTEYLDDGSADCWSLYHYVLNGSGSPTSANYSFAPLFENGQGYLNVYGSNAGDPMSWDAVYAESIAAGWDPKATIERIELLEDPPGGFITAYRVNFRWCQFFDQLSMTDEFFEDSDKIIVLNACRLVHRTETRYGHISTDYDSTHSGVLFILSGHGFTFGSVAFNTSSNYLARVYDCEARVAEFGFSVSTNYSAGFSLNGDDWELVDFKCKGRINDQALNNSLAIYRATSGCELRRVALARHRYGGWNSAASAFVIDALNIWTWSGTGFISYQSRSDDIERTMSGISIFGLEGYGESFYLRRRSATWAYQTKLAVIDSFIFDFTRVRWYGTTAEPPEIPGSYVDLRFSLDVRVAENDGSPIAGATVTLLDNSLTPVVSATTGGTGEIATQTVTTRRNEPDPTQHPSSSYVGGVVTEFGPFQIVVSAPGFDDFQTEFDIEQATALEVGLNPAGTAFAEALAVEVESDALEATVADTALIVTLEELDADLEARAESVTVNENETEVSE